MEIPEQTKQGAEQKNQKHREAIPAQECREYHQIQYRQNVCHCFVGQKGLQAQEIVESLYEFGVEPCFEVLQR